jgi:two-component system, OmpR family, alkaline phosphatase synthesis response regulator PhoP
MSKILVAEDEKDIRELVGFTLQLAGHQIDFASNGEEAIRHAKLDHPDLVILDYRMPVMNGDIAAEKMKADPQLSHIPIVFLTAKEKDPAIAGQIANGYHFIAKPFSIDQFNRKIKEVLELSVQV